MTAYGHCSDASSVEICDTAKDGVRLAWRDAGATAFTKKTFTDDDEDTDGLKTDMAVAADDTIVTLGYNATQSQVTIKRIHKVTTP